MATKWICLTQVAKHSFPQNKKIYSLLKETPGQVDNNWKIFAKIVRNWRYFLPQKIRVFTVRLSSCHLAKVIVSTIWQLIPGSKHLSMYTHFLINLPKYETSLSKLASGQKQVFNSLQIHPVSYFWTHTGKPTEYMLMCFEYLECTCNEYGQVRIYLKNKKSFRY